MESNKILTISIAAYNAEKYIDKCLSSLICIKNFDKLDIILVDDGSKDRTYEFAKAYEDKYPNIVRVIKKVNGGWGSTINTSLKLAKSKYYKLLDVDDFYNSKNLDNFIDFLEETNSDIVISPFEYYYINSCKYELNDYFHYQMHSLTIKTSILQDNKVSITEKCFYADVEFSLKCIKYAKTYEHFAKPIYIYSIGIGEQSISDKSFKKNINQHFTILKNLIEKEYNEIIDNDKYDNKTKKIFTNRLQEMIAKHYSVLFKFKPSENGKEKIKEFDTWLKNASTNLYDLIELKRVKIFRKNDKLYLLIYIGLFIRSFLYNLLRRK